MKTYRADWMVRLLTGVVSFAYYGTWVVAVLIVVVAPALKNLTPNLVVDPEFRVGFPVTLAKLGDTAVTQWDVAPLDVQVWQVTGFLSLPNRQLPAWVPIVTYSGVAVAMMLALLFLHTLRALFRRLREGAPFDANNAARMRWVGMWLLAFHVFYGGLSYLMSRWLAREMASSGVAAGPVLDINWFAVLVALVLMALAEVFRRGATLEEEQSLVV